MLDQTERVALDSLFRLRLAASVVPAAGGAWDEA